MSVEQMKLKTTGQLAEIGRSSEAIGRLKGELAERAAAFAVLQDKEMALAGQLRTTEAELGAKSKALEHVEKTLADRKAELANSWPSSTCTPRSARSGACTRPRLKT